MSNIPKPFADIQAIAAHLRETLDGTPAKAGKQFITLFAHNGIGKTRLSMAFKDIGKHAGNSDTLYYNAFTEDLFSWENDLDSDSDRHLKFIKGSMFFVGLPGLDMENKIRPLLERYVDFDFTIDYEEGTVRFRRQVVINGNGETVSNIKVSRGEENMFIWCFYLAIAQLAVEKHPDYTWVKYLYIDDPISSLDEHNTVTVACHLSELLNAEGNTLKAVISTHHSLFYNVMHNEFSKRRMPYFLHRNKDHQYTLLDTGDTPFYHHLAMLAELKQLSDAGTLQTYHFNSMRSVMEKTSVFLGYSQFEHCLSGVQDKQRMNRMLNLLSHGKYSLFAPVEMGEDRKEIFQEIMLAFQGKYQFNLKELAPQPAPAAGNQQP